MNWIDLSPYGMALFAVDLPHSGEGRAPRILVMVGAEAHAETVKSLGFRLHEASGQYVIAGIPSGSALMQAFPLAKQMIDVDPRSVRKQFGGPATNVENVPVLPTAVETKKRRTSLESEGYPVDEQIPLEVLLAQSSLLGLNAMGHEVYEGVRGRFMRPKDGAAIFETANPAMGSGLFLRGSDTRSMAVAADGFVAEIAAGSVMRFSELQRFASAVFASPIEDTDPRLLDAHSAIEAAMSRWLVRKGYTLAQMQGGAAKLQEGHPYLGDLSRHVKRDLRETPQAIAVAVARAIGFDELDGKRILVHGGGTALYSYLPKVADVRVYGSIADATEATMMLSALRRPETAFSSTPPKEDDFAQADVIVMDVPSNGLLSQAFQVDGIAFSRQDSKLVLDALKARHETGRAVFLIRAGASPEELEEIGRLHTWIASRYYVEGAADIEAGLHSGRADGSSLRMLVIGKRRPSVSEIPHAASMRLSRIESLASLGTWASTITANRHEIAEFDRALEEAVTAEEDGAPDPDLEGNNFQAPYEAICAIGQASTMVPRNLNGATREALARIAHAKGNVAEWVAAELGMTLEQLSERLSPEQADGVAMAIYAEERNNRACLIADQTGIGKGRCISAMMLRAVLRGQKVFFLTEREINFSDIVRDLRDIGAWEFMSPLILNNEAKIVDERSGEIIMSSRKRAETMAIIEAGQFPDDVNLIIASYSQFNRPGIAVERRRKRGGELPPVEAVHPKAAFIRKVVDENVLLVLDECHNAASANSNIASNINHAAKNCGSLIFSSATFAKNAKNMAIYSRLFPQDFDTSNLTDIIRKGGETIQETLSSMLAKDGVMIRREHDLSKCDFRMIMDEGNLDRNQQYMDMLAPILAEMAYLSGDLDKRINAINAGLVRQLRAQGVNDNHQIERRMKSLQVTRVGFGSPLYNLSRIFLASLLVDKASEEAIASLRSGEQKPVILVDSTIQAIMEEIAQGQDDIEGLVVPDFKHLMRRALGQLTRFTKKSENEEAVVEDISVGHPLNNMVDRIIDRMVASLPDEVGLQPEQDSDPAFREGAVNLMLQTTDIIMDEVNDDEADLVAQAIEVVRNHIEMAQDGFAPTVEHMVRRLPSLIPDTPAKSVRRINAMIDALPDLPASAIDAVRDRIEAAGFSCGEITGRTMECRNGRILRREKMSKTVIKNAFNSGRLDALIINQAGSTGIDLHASRRFADQRQRVLIGLQEPADITKLLQAYGRVNRFDQVKGPCILSCMAGLPIETRLFGMRNQKLRRLSANVTSNRDHAALFQDIPDLMNVVGDIVCARYAEARPDLMRRLGFDPDKELEREEGNRNNAEKIAEDQKDTQRSANAFLARLAMLSVAQQRNTLEELEAEYKATLQEMDARGENPLKSKRIEGKVHSHPADRYILEGAELENPLSEFHRPVYVQKVFIEHEIEPLRGNKVMEEVERGLIAQGMNTPEAYSHMLERNKERMLGIYMPLMAANLQEALADEKNRTLRMMNNRIEQLIEALAALTPGCGIKLNIEQVAEEGILTGITPPDHRYMHLASAYEIKLAVPSQTKILRFSLGALLSDSDYAVTEGLNGPDADNILRAFDTAMDGRAIEVRQMLVGNEWNAMNLSIKHKLGTMTAWEDQDGISHRGILVSKKHKDLDFMPVSLTIPSLVSDLCIQENAEIYGTPTFDFRSLHIRRADNGQGFYISLPETRSREYGHIYESPGVQAMVQQYNTTNPSSPRLNVPEEHLETVVGHLLEAGSTLFVNSRKRPWVNAWKAANMGAPDRPGHP
jgi:C-terminal domain on Strawberry notch homologue/P-loop containing NTP hydrolase pore-1